MSSPMFELRNLSLNRAIGGAEIGKVNAEVVYCDNAIQVLIVDEFGYAQVVGIGMDYRGVLMLTVKKHGAAEQSLRHELYDARQTEEPEEGEGDANEPTATPVA